MTTETPRWFRNALAEVPEHRDTVLDGCRIHLRCWGDPAGPGLLLVHGGSAHSGWWDHIGPLLATTHRVVALDLSGHGDSGRRPSYDLKLWARELVPAARAGGIEGPCFVAGHSMGGWVTAMAGALIAGELSGVAIIDSPLNDRPPEEERIRRRRRPTKVYPTREEIIERFVTLPPQEVVLPYIRENVAAQSIHAVDGGWTWKFDPFMFGPRTPLRDMLPEISCPRAYLRCEHGLVPPEMLTEIDRLLGHRGMILELPDAGHHPMLDQPLPLVTALRAVLARSIR